MRKIVVMCCAVALLGAKKPEIVAPTGWADITDRDACALQAGRVGLGVIEGNTFLLGIEGPHFGNPATREIEFEGTRVVLAFRDVQDGVAAQLDSASLALLYRARSVRIPWLESEATQDLPNVPAALDALSACASKRAQRAQAAERRREFAARLAAAGAAMQSAAPDDDGSGPQGGVTCFKRREWTSGFNKNCVYDCLGSEAVQTIGAAQLCPLTIRR